MCCKSHTHAANIKFQPNACYSCFKQCSRSCLEGRIYIITLLNPSPVLVALKILRDILSFTRSLMINTHPLVGCLENSDRKVKQFRVIPRIALLSGLVYCSSIHCECVWFCNVTPDLYRETLTQHTLRKPNGLARMDFKSSSVIILVYSCKAKQTRFECSLLF